MPPRKKASKTSAKKTDAQDKIPSRSDRASSLMDDFNKKMKGRAVIKKASDYELPYLYRRIPTGLLSLDLALRGGFPGGGLSQIAGPKGSLKNWMVWQAVRQLQYFLGDDAHVLLAMTELRADRSQARLGGVKIGLGDKDIQRYLRSREDFGMPPPTEEDMDTLREEVGQIHELHGMSAEDLYDGIISAVEKNIYHLIVIDSFGAIMSAAEAEASSLSEKRYGGSAKVNTEFLRKIGGLLTLDDAYGRPRDPAIVGLNQVRAAIGDPHKEFKFTGGNMLEHAQFVNLVMRPGPPIGSHESQKTVTGSKQSFVQTGKEVRWVIEKGKAGIREGVRGTVLYDFRIGTADFYMDTLVEGVKNGIVEQSGAWYGIQNPEDPEKYLVRTQGAPAFLQALIEDEKEKAGSDELTLMNYIRDEAFRRNEIFVDYTNWD